MSKMLRMGLKDRVALTYNSTDQLFANEEK